MTSEQRRLLRAVGIFFGLALVAILLLGAFEIVQPVVVPTTTNHSVHILP